MAGQQIIKKHPYLKEIYGYEFGDFGAIVAAASLAHDIGNPPFGHSGEKAIGEYFKNGKGQRFKSHLTDKQYQDLIDFEGNANGLKLLCENRKGIQGGLRLSYATLGAFIKYPKESLPKKPSKHIADKKFGFFQSNKEMVTAIAEELGLISRGKDGNLAYHRHPLVYLVEAADDICYTIIDFEDGINLGLIPEAYALEYLIKLVKDKINTEKYHELVYTADRLSYLRALAISTLIEEAVEIFMKNEEDILAGNFDAALMDRSKYKAQIEDIINLSVSNIYESTEVIDKEIAGYSILSDLLEVYCTAMEHLYLGNPSNYHKLILKSIPASYREIPDNLYDLLLNTSSYIASLSDSRAVNLHAKIKGVHL
jgi:dGTPase